MQYRQFRYPAQFPVPVLTPVGRQTGQVTNVHAEGAKLSGLRGLRRGDKIQLDVLSQHVEAIVLWTDRVNTGVCFRPRLSTRVLDTLHHRSQGRASGYRPSVGFREVASR